MFVDFTWISMESTRLEYSRAGAVFRYGIARTRCGDLLDECVAGLAFVLGVGEIADRIGCGNEFLELFRQLFPQDSGGLVGGGGVEDAHTTVREEFAEV